MYQVYLAKHHYLVVNSLLTKWPNSCCFSPNSIRKKSTPTCKTLERQKGR